MADFVRKKLQVFVSSTYDDLKVERQAAVSAILSAGHIPAGMELFTAGDESQMEVIKQWIDESDVFLLILGGRYGSLEPTSGKSYTHLEYEYALSKNKPLFACVITDGATDVRVRENGKAFIETENGGKLSEFRTLVLNKLCKLWEDAKDIKIAVAETLAHIARRDDLVGWVRANNQMDSTQLLNEMSRLSQENAKLREESGKVTATPEYVGLSYFELKALLEKSGAIRTLLSERSALARGRADLKGPDRDELLQRGLIVRNPDTYDPLYLATDIGTKFLNKFDYESLHSDKGQPSSEGFEL